MKCKVRNLILGLTLLAPALYLEAAEFYVSAAGRDSNPGTLQEPFATIVRARDEVRKLIASGVKEDVSVFIRGGTYALTQPIVFGLEDSATGGRTITYAAYGDERPLISSGVKIAGWRKWNNPPLELPAGAKDKVWVADVPTSLGRFYSLYDSHGPLPRAQSEGFMIETPPGEAAGSRPRTLDSHRNLHYPAGTLKDWSNLDDVEVVVRASVVWTMNILALESVDKEARVARTQLPSSYALRPLRGQPQPSAWVENVLEALDQPGEWVLNTHTKKLYLWPRGATPEGILAPAVPELIRVEGKIDVKGPTDVPVRGLVFRGLTFAHADRDSWVQGDRGIQHDWEMEDKPDALIRLRGAENCVIEHCKFKDSGGNAIRLDYYAQGNRISGNEIRNLGQGGIILIGYGPGTKDVNKRNQILNNHIHHSGLLYWHSVAIMLWQSGENRVANNYVHDHASQAIVLSGARFPYFQRGPSATREVATTFRWFEIGPPLKSVSEYQQALRFLHTRNNLVEDNKVARVMQKLGDAAAMNISGAGVGNVLRHNYIHDITANGTAVLRNDGWQSGSLWEDNVIVRSNIYFGENKGPNDLINNIAIDMRLGRPTSGYYNIQKAGTATDPQDYATGSGFLPMEGSRIERNIFYQSKGEGTFYLFRTYLESPKELDFDVFKGMTVNNNLYYNAEVPSPSVPQFMRDMYARGLGLADQYADPLFVDAEHGDYRLKPESPARKLGIKSIDVSTCGINKDFPKWLLE
jgi:hypothetical protein